MGGKGEAFLRGAGQGATANFGDEAIAKILASLPVPDDKTGIPREYSQGSAEKDYLNTERNANEASSAAYPLNYGAGQVLGAAPSALALPAGAASAGSRVALAGLSGGLAGGLNGAGAATEGGRLEGAARGAGPGAALGMLGAGAVEAAPAALRALKGMPQESAATTGGMQMPIPERGPQVNRAQAMRPEASGSPSSAPPAIPRAGKTGFRESMLPEAADKYAEAADVVHGNKMLGREHAANDVSEFQKYAAEFDKSPAPKAAEPVMQTEQSVSKTVRPGKKGAAPKKGIPTQQELPLRPAEYEAGGDLEALKWDEGGDPTHVGSNLNQTKYEDIGKLADSARKEYASLSDVDRKAESAWAGYDNNTPAVREQIAKRAGEKPHEYGESLFRGMGLPKETIESMQRTGKYTAPAVSSWSANPKIANEFATGAEEGVPTMFRQKGGKGVPVGKDTYESEMILPGGDRHVQDVSQSADGTYQVLLGDMPKEAVPDASAHTDQLGLDLSTQHELPGVPEPEYSYHATEPKNVKGIAEVGLRPEEGGKNFKFKKNEGRVYMSPEKDAQMWKQKLEDMTGEKPVELRTPLKSQQVPGANDAVRIRTEAVPPERLQYKKPTGDWGSVKDFLGEMPTEKTADLNQTSLDFSKPAPFDPFKNVQQEFGGMNKKVRFPEESVVRNESTNAWSDSPRTIRDADRASTPNQHADVIKNAITEKGVSPEILYRGTGSDDPSALLGGGALSQDALSSWSTSPSIAKFFSKSQRGQKPVILRARGQKGLATGGPDDLYESEVITPKNDFSVEQVSQDPDGAYQVKLGPKQRDGLGEMPTPREDVSPDQMTLDEQLQKLGVRR